MNDAENGCDTVGWVARQPWCDGKVGMAGGSYGGHVQWQAARLCPPHLATLVSTAAPGRWMPELPYVNGKFLPGMMWLLNLIGGRTMQENLAARRSQRIVDFGRLLRHRPLKAMGEALGRPDSV